MALKTTLEQLENVQAAIEAVLNNQSYTLDGRSITRADLGKLEAREMRLERKYNKENGRRPRVARANFGGAFS